MDLRTKQIVLVTLVAVAVALATSATNAITLASSVVGITRSRTELLAQTLYHLARRVIREHSEGDLKVDIRADQALRTYAQGVVGYSDITLYLAIVDREGVVVFHSEPGLEGERVGDVESLTDFARQSGPAQLWDLMKGDQILAIDLPFSVVERQPFGVVRVAISTLLLKRQILALIARDTAIAAACVLVVFLISFYAARRLLAPIELLRRELSRIDVGVDQPPLDLRSREDVARLAEFFSTLNRATSGARASREGDRGWLNVMLGGFSDAVLLVNEERRVVSLNAAACRLFGREHAAIEGRSIDELLAPDHPLRLLLDEVLNGGRSISSRRIALDVERASVTFMMTLNLIRDPARPSGVMIIARDLDRLTRLGSHLAYAQKLTALGELTSGVAHEIKGPLNAMVIHASLLKEKLGDAGDGIERHIDVLLRQIRHLEQVVQGFLRFTRPEKPRFERVDLGDVIDDALRELAEQAGLDGIRVERQIPSGLSQVHGDRHLLAQAVYNLLDNARHAMRGEGVLRIACHPAAGGRVALRIEDSGVGMPRDVLPKIFDLFYTTSETGSGIGLSLVYRIVQLHGGEIAVASVPGEGSRFTIDLPEASL